MVLDKNKIGWLLIAWAFFLVVAAVAVPVIVPIVLMIVGTIIYLL